MDIQQASALTSSAVMAGGGMSAVWSSGDIRAWFDVEADFLLVFEPFHYYISAGIHLGASFTVDLWFTSFTVSIHLGVDLGNLMIRQDAETDLAQIGGVTARQFETYRAGCLGRRSGNGRQHCLEIRRARLVAAPERDDPAAIRIERIGPAPIHEERHRLHWPIAGPQAKHEINMQMRRLRPTTTLSCGIDFLSQSLEQSWRRCFEPFPGAVV